MSTLSLWARRDPFAELDTVVDAFLRRLGEPSASAGSCPPPRSAATATTRSSGWRCRASTSTRTSPSRSTPARLVVRGERRDERSEERDGRSLRELRYGSFRRSFALPAHVGPDAVSASYDAGVPTVRVTGAHAGRGARRIPVGTGSPALEAGERAA